MKNNRLNSEDIKYLIQNYKRYPIAIVRGSGSWVYDSNGKKYLDFTTGIAVNNLGHNNPVINSSIKKQLKKELPNVVKKELEKMLKSKDIKADIGEIAKKVIKKLYKDLSFHHPYIIDRIKV